MNRPCLIYRVHGSLSSLSASAFDSTDPFFFFFALSPLTPTGREKLIEAANTVNLARWRHGVPEGETGVVKEKGRGTPEVLASAPGFQLAGVKFGLVA